MSDEFSDYPVSNNTSDVTQDINNSTKTSSDFDFALPSGSVKSKNLTEDVPKYFYPTKSEPESTVSEDHCYARPWNWRPETSFLRPTKSLFVNQQIPGTRKSSNPLISLQTSEEIIDVETDIEVSSELFPVDKFKNVLDESLKFSLSARPDKNEEDWEEKISRINWTSTQNKLFNNMVNILNSLKLAKLACTSVHNEPLLRYNIIRKAVQRVRRLMSTIAWDPKLTQWLHQLLMDNLDPYYLACYLDILQALKSKLPSFVEKMIASSSKLGPLSNSNVSQLLDKSWEPIFSSLDSVDKPKKLPGNPIIVVVPTAPIVPKIINKWIKLLSNLATVVTVPTNFGSTGHKMTMTNCVDQLFSLTRGKIQEVRSENPGRNIILVGFSAGATLALQVAQMEPVLCVISVGFSLLTADGKRGEPEDNLLELQCPVLFVIGQRSNTSFQEDMEDLRERMRVETGLIVVGSADDYLRISKKKQMLEGITQAMVDRQIFEEVGNFISGLILSPYPPQIRQSSSTVNTESSGKKAKVERTRYNSNASSVDSEPPSPSPTPRITRPVGRPPGSKSKSRLEAKWAQQIAKGNTTDPTPSPKPNSPIIPPLITLDTQTHDNTPSEKPLSTNPDTPIKKPPDTPVKKLKTLKPVVSPIKQASAMVKTPPHQARMQAYGLNRSIIPGGNLSTLLQGGIKTIPPSQPKTSVSGIKVLENVTLNSPTTRLIQNKASDVSKLTLMNTAKSSSTSAGNVFLLPDGKLKTVQGNKYITTKRQLLGQRPPRPTKPPVYMASTPIQATLPPPTNLTTQDIMELPIIFADDNKILEPSITTSPITQVTPTATFVSTSISNTPVSIATPKVLQTITPGKFMLVNKQATNISNFIISPTNIKKQSPMAGSKQPPKYTKIILSSKKHNLEKLTPTTPKLHNISSEITTKKVLPNKNIQEHLIKEDPTPMVELIDLENEIKATAVPKPNIGTDKYINVSNKELLIANRDASFVMKRSSSVLENVDDSDPDYVPPKNLKLK